MKLEVERQVANSGAGTQNALVGVCVRDSMPQQHATTVLHLAALVLLPPSSKHQEVAGRLRGGSWEAGGGGGVGGGGEWGRWGGVGCKDRGPNQSIRTSIRFDTGVCDRLARHVVGLGLSM